MMIRWVKTVVAGILATAGLSGCGNSVTLPENLQPCPETRPQVCPMMYQPVCGYHPDGSATTYSHACVACSKADVVGVVPGDCRE